MLFPSRTHSALPAPPADYQERLGSANAGLAYAAFSYEAANEDELSFRANEELTVLRKGDATEKEWYWARDNQGHEGYVPRNFLAVSFARADRRKGKAVAKS